jgi:hypothetical protein
VIINLMIVGAYYKFARSERNREKE